MNLTDNVDAGHTRDEKSFAVVFWRTLELVPQSVQMLMKAEAPQPYLTALMLVK